MTHRPQDAPHPPRPTVVFVHAHPDDEAIFTAIAMRRLADADGRVVLVTATKGEEGGSRVRLSRGESVAARRVRELERSCSELGVDRLVLLGHRDSGVVGAASNEHRRALARRDPALDERRLAALLEQESADALVHYDGTGIYGHPDHVAVHRLGSAVAARTGVPAYEATVDREHLAFVDTHLVERAAPSGVSVGRATAEIGLALRATGAELAVKAAAMAAHASQIDPAVFGSDRFAEVYGLEWFVRTQGRPVLESLGNEHALAG